MAREVLNLKQAAAHIHLDAAELRHAAQRGEIEASEHGGDWHFEHSALDEWAQRNFLALSFKEQSRQHRVMMEEERRAHNAGWRISSLFPMAGMKLGLTAKGKAGVVRDMTELAACTGLVYDPDALYKELIAREEIASTAIGNGAAFLHPRFHDPYLFEESFIAYGRSEQSVYFGAPDGEPTRHFFLICSTNHDEHLRILARLAMMAHSTEFLTLLGEVEDLEAVRRILCAAEDGVM